jgi:ParB-like chromosome segregation protein Spo0J
MPEKREKSQNHTNGKQSVVLANCLRSIQMNIKINPEFQRLCPPLTEEEREQLEKNIIADGCIDPLILWNGTLIDGHNRLDICQKNDIPFETVQKNFESEDDAKRWIVLNQFGRRNLNKFQRCEVALTLEPSIAKKANENQGKRTDIPKNSAESYSEFIPTSTRDELAKVASVSHETISRVKRILDSGIQEIIEAARIGEASINAAYAVTLLSPEEQNAVLNEVGMGKSVKDAMNSLGASRGKRKKPSNNKTTHQNCPINNGAENESKLSSTALKTLLCVAKERLNKSVDNSIEPFKDAGIIETGADRSDKKETISVMLSKVNVKKPKVEDNQTQKSLSDEINSEANIIVPPNYQNDSEKDNPENKTITPSSDGTQEDSISTNIDVDLSVVKTLYYSFKDTTDSNGMPIKFRCNQHKNGEISLSCKPEHTEEFKGLLRRMGLQLCV